MGKLPVVYYVCGSVYSEFKIGPKALSSTTCEYALQREIHAALTWYIAFFCGSLSI